MDFLGLITFQVVGIFDGKFGEALEESDITFDREVEAISIANFMGLFTVAFVFNELQAKKMLKAGADILCVHLGLTKGGMLGAKESFSIEKAKVIADKIFDITDESNPTPIKMIYGGPASTPIDLKYLYENSQCKGYIGGSSFERIPIERAIVNATRAFKSFGSFDENDIMVKALSGTSSNYDYVDFVKTYVKDNYMKDIKLSELALVAHISYTYLSTKFKREEGCSFTDYLVKYRLEKAVEIMMRDDIPMKDIALMVGV